jgi:UDP-hydrolysing UDP-N-acetyl-D-glucosamine 2-epimerase
VQCRSIAIVTTGRADYGLLTPVFRALDRHRTVRPRWIVTGMHLSRRFGYSADQIDADGWDGRIERVEGLVDGDSSLSIARSISTTTSAFARAFGNNRPDLLVVLGDRFETLGVVAAALPFRIPIAHLHGGELTEGAFDDAIRHAITKLSHLHFVAHATYARRVRQLGEERWRIVISGAPGLDRERLRSMSDVSEIEAALGRPIDRKTLLVTYHPETLHPDRSLEELDRLLRAIDRLQAPAIFTAPNADPGRDAHAAALADFAAAARYRVLVPNLGDRYFGVLRRIGAMVGNSSSGIIEAPSFALPAVNIGDRQRGRIRARNVIDVKAGSRELEAAIRRALSAAFRTRLRGLVNPYGDGRAADRIAKVLATVPLGDRLLVKRFADTRVA